VRLLNVISTICRLWDLVGKLCQNFWLL